MPGDGSPNVTYNEKGPAIRRAFPLDVIVSQYSSGNSTHVEERSASVIIQKRVPFTDV